MTSPTAQSIGTAYTPTTVDPAVVAAYQIFNAREFDAIDRVFAADAVLTNVATGQQFVGPAGVRDFMDGWLAGFPDGHIEITTLAQSGDVVVCEFRGTGTHTGTFHTPMGDIPPTGRRIEVAFCEVSRVRDGKIASLNAYFDSATFAAQLAG